MANPNSTCSVNDCDNPIINSRGWCWTHYQRWRRHGDPLKLKKTPNGEVQRYFDEIVCQYDGDECLLWPYAKTSGYPVLGQERAHRLLCEKIHGPAPSSDHHAAHSCGNGHLGCITKKHLRWATPKENNADKFIHDTHTRGERHGQAKLTEELVREIRRLSKSMPWNKVADELGVSRAGVRNVLAGTTWKWVKD